MTKFSKAACIFMCVVSSCVCAAFFMPESFTEAETAVCRTMKINGSVCVSGVLERENTRLIAPPALLPVESVYVAKGDFVKRGQALFKLNTAELEAQLGALYTQSSLAETISKGTSAHLAPQIALLEKQIAACTARADGDGYVLSVNVTPGLAASGGVVLAGKNSVLRVLIPDSKLNGIKAGQTVEARRDGSVYRGALEAPEASAAFAGFFEALVTLPQASALPLGAGMDAEIIIGETTGPSVPLEALFAREDAVLCVIDGIAVKTPVEVLEQDSRHAAISSVPEGTVVVLYPESVPEGSKIKAPE